MFAYSHNFARVTARRGGLVSLKFELDRARWPWLSLPPQHPVLLEKYQYFATMTAVMAQPDYDPSRSTALTHFSWSCPPLRDPAHATDAWCQLEDGRFTGELRAADAVVARFAGLGHYFDDRDFVAWRERARAKVLAREPGRPLEYASPEAVGLDAAGVSFVGPLALRDGVPAAPALVTRARGLAPAHPFHTGSGDHVNAGHLFDCALQAAHLVLARPLTCIGGQASFTRFVELDARFELRVTQSTREDPTPQARFAVIQQGRDCAQLSLGFAPG